MTRKLLTYGVLLIALYSYHSFMQGLTYTAFVEGYVEGQADVLTKAVIATNIDSETFTTLLDFSNDRMVWYYQVLEEELYGNE